MIKSQSEIALIGDSTGTTVVTPVPSKLKPPIVRIAIGGYSMYEVTYYHNASSTPQVRRVPANRPEEAWLSTVKHCCIACRAVAYHCVSILPVEKRETKNKGVEYVETPEPGLMSKTMENGKKTGGF